jgi:hypothetical protein
VITSPANTILPIPTSQPSALPALPPGVKEIFIGLDSFTFNPPGAWVTVNNSICDSQTNGGGGKMGTQENATFSFNVTGGKSYPL